MQSLTIVKVGGKIVENPVSMQNLLRHFQSLPGYKMLVHGGGRSATSMGERLGIESKMVNGRRVTDADMLEVVTMVYGGLVNKRIVAALQSQGVNALGLTGADLDVIRSVRRPVVDVDYGFVGDVKKVNDKMLASLINQQIVPVLAPLTHDGNGQILNTNADTMAGESAKALTPYFDVTLVYCFEKKGVLLSEDDDDSVIPSLNFSQFQEYVAQGVIGGGMIPKLQNAFSAIQNGVRRVIITQSPDVEGIHGTTCM